MLTELLLRFVLGGLLVTLFAVLGDTLRPRSFAGIFGAAPSVALATLGLTFALEGAGHAVTEARSMVLGAVALLAYAILVHHLLARRDGGAWQVTAASWLGWLAVAFGLWAVLLR